MVPDSERVDLSVVSPVFNERDNVYRLHQSLVDALDPLGRSFELLYVDDGSHDGTDEELRRAAAEDPRVKVIRLRRNFGQSAAIAAGVDHARGAIVVFIDADLQNDPKDIPRLLARLDEGYDVVSGWRRDRQDPRLRTVASGMANWLISRVTGVRLHDYGCTLKAYRAEVLSGFQLYGEMHRFIPAYLSVAGARVTEMPVQHAPRTSGESKYGMGRTFKVILDLLTVKFLGSYGTKPIYLFGGVGLFCLVAAVLVASAMVWQKYSLGVSLIQTPLLLLATILSLVGVQSILLGLLAEVLMRTYYESQGKRPYIVREVIDGGPE